MRLRESIIKTCALVALAVSVLCPASRACAGAIYIQLSAPSEVCIECPVTVRLTASDCDQYSTACCWDDLTFPDWQGDAPVKGQYGTYTADWTITCDWIGERTFTVTADDQAACPVSQENDDPGMVSVTIVGVRVDSIEGPTEPLCPEDPAVFWATTYPPGHHGLLSWSGGGDPPGVQGTDWFCTHWDTGGMKTVRVKCGSDTCGASELTWPVEVYEPSHSVRFLPTPGAGGTIPVEVEACTRCANLGLAFDMLKEKELPDDHGEGWKVIPDPSIRTVGEENGVTTQILSWC